MVDIDNILNKPTESKIKSKEQEDSDEMMYSP